MVIKIKSNELNKDLIYHFNKSNELKDFSNIIDRRSIKQIDSIIDDFDISYNDKEPINLHELILKISCKLFKTSKLRYIDSNINLSNSNNYDIIRHYIKILNKNFKSKDPKRSTSDESIKEVKADYIKEIGLSKIKKEPEIKIDGDNNTKIELLPTILNFPKILESKIDKIIKEKISKKLKEINDEKKKDEIADLVKESKKYNAQMFPIIITLIDKTYDKPILITLTDKTYDDKPILITLTDKTYDDKPMLITLTDKTQEDHKSKKPLLITLTDKTYDDKPMLITLTDKTQEDHKSKIPLLITLTDKTYDDKPMLITLTDKTYDDIPMLITLTDKTLLEKEVTKTNEKIVALEESFENLKKVKKDIVMGADYSAINENILKEVDEAIKSIKDLINLNLISDFKNKEQQNSINTKLRQVINKLKIEIKKDIYSRELKSKFADLIKNLKEVNIQVYILRGIIKLI